MTFPIVYPPSTALGAQPNHTPFGQRLRDRTQPLAPDDPDYLYAHAHLAEALARPYLQFQQAFDPADGTAPFSPLLDPARCPAWALPWLAQLAGVGIPATATEADARTIVAGLAGQKRGTTAMLEAAAGLYLTGTKTVFFRERHILATDPPYALEVVTRINETPDQAKVLAALMAQKPAGIVLSYRLVAGWDYEQQTTVGPHPYSATAAAFATYTLLQEG